MSDNDPNTQLEKLPLVQNMSKVRSIARSSLKVSPSYCQMCISSASECDCHLQGRMPVKAFRLLSNAESSFCVLQTLVPVAARMPRSFVPCMAASPNPKSHAPAGNGISPPCADRCDRSTGDINRACLRRIAASPEQPFMHCAEFSRSEGLPRGQSRRPVAGPILSRNRNKRGPKATVSRCARRRRKPGQTGGASWLPRKGCGPNSQ